MQFFQIFKYENPAFAVAADPLDLGVVLVAGNQDDLPLGRMLGNDAVNFCNKRTGRVGIRHAAFRKHLVDVRRHAMGPDYNDLVRPGLFGRVDDARALFLQILDQLRIVDDRAEGAHFFALRKQLVYKRDGAVNAKTETRCFGYGNRPHHGASSSSVIRSVSTRQAFLRAEAFLPFTRICSFGIGLP